MTGESGNMFKTVTSVLLGLLFSIQAEAEGNQQQLLVIEDEYYFPYANCLTPHVDLSAMDQLSVKFSENPYTDHVYPEYAAGCQTGEDHFTFIILSNYHRFDFNGLNRPGQPGTKPVTMTRLVGQQVTVTVADQLGFDDGISAQLVFETAKGLVFYLDLLYSHSDAAQRKGFVCDRLKTYAELNNDARLEEGLAMSELCFARQ
jgi:hypothetical protein